MADKNIYEEFQIRVSFNKVQLINFTLTENAHQYQKPLPDDKYEFFTEFKIEVDLEDKKVLTWVYIVLRNLDTKDDLAMFNAHFQFRIENIENFIRKAEKEGVEGLQIDSPIYLFAIATSIGTARGMLAMKLMETTFANAILPVMDASTFLPKEV
jgi:hypothetical protein